ncbi:protein-tyrosine sulfotransferase 1-like [Saccostrea cucullata]|uniref:protein-tyrosine sulfotransferase 1-like n=1 Tax=Saccostrea cuccullata TaxID=36930 RepID=UPI002ED31F11
MKEVREPLTTSFIVRMRGLTKYSTLLILFWIGALTVYISFQQNENDRPKILEGGIQGQYSAPLIFIGGVPRSGTTLMRVMLDAHQDVRCGEETRVIPRILRARTDWTKSERERKRLAEAGLNNRVLDSAVGAFIMDIIQNHGDPAPWLCNKDPFTLKHSIYLSKLFPKAKFLLMVRDGRASVHSIISRKVTVSNFDLKDPKNCLEKWNAIIENMYSQCLHIGPRRCMPVYYEQLSLHPELWMRRILKFLEIPWSNNVLHHQDFIGKKGGASLSQSERSTDQVVKPVNLEALSKWVGTYPTSVVRNMGKIAPMLRRLGYDPELNPPQYDHPDPRIADNTLHLQQHKKYWRNKGVEVTDQRL